MHPGILTNAQITEIEEIAMRCALGGCLLEYWVAFSSLVFALNDPAHQHIHQQFALEVLVIPMLLPFCCALLLLLQLLFDILELPKLQLERLHSLFKLPDALALAFGMAVVRQLPG